MTTRRHYAIPDPDDPGQMTYWRDSRPGRGVRFVEDGLPHIEPWPSKAVYGPMLYRKDLPEDHDAGEAVRDEYYRRRGGWVSAVRLAVAADPVVAGRRFAELTSR
jgi:hypothetical protein